MKSAFLLNQDPRMIEHLKGVLDPWGPNFDPNDDGYIQIFDAMEGVLTIFGISEDLEWEFKEGPFEMAQGGAIPDMSDLKGCTIECRSEVFFAFIANLATKALPGQSWVLDSNGVIWPAEDVDPRLICL